MNRFALIPLALLSIACAESDALETETAERSSLESLENHESARSTVDYERVVKVIRAYERDPSNDDCTALGMVEVRADHSARQAEARIIDSTGATLGNLHGTAIMSNDGHIALDMKSIEEREQVVHNVDIAMDIFGSHAEGEWVSPAEYRGDFDVFKLSGRVTSAGGKHLVHAVVAFCD
jgi:hypothetical protein